jgi:hypothetical protein
VPETLAIILEWFDIIVRESVMFWFVIDHTVLNSRVTLLKAYSYIFCSKIANLNAYSTK